MFQPKWTPGPWEWTENKFSLNASDNEWVLCPSNARTANPQSFADALGAYGYSSEARAEANARLMSASPEMAQVLMQIANCEMPETPSDADARTLLNRLIDFRIAARAALKKAGVE